MTCYNSVEVVLCVLEVLKSIRDLQTMVGWHALCAIGGGGGKHCSVSVTHSDTR